MTDDTTTATTYRSDLSLLSSPLSSEFASKCEKGDLQGLKTFRQQHHATKYTILDGVNYGLFLACVHKHEEVAVWILDTYPDAHPFKTYSNETAFYITLKDGLEAVVKAICIRHKALLETSEDLSEYAIHYCISYRPAFIKYFARFIIKRDVHSFLTWVYATMQDSDKTGIANDAHACLVEHLRYIDLSSFVKAINLNLQGHPFANPDSKEDHRRFIYSIEVIIGLMKMALNVPLLRIFNEALETDSVHLIAFLLNYDNLNKKMNLKDIGEYLISAASLGRRNAVLTILNGTHRTIPREVVLEAYKCALAKAHTSTAHADTAAAIEERLQLKKKEERVDEERQQHQRVAAINTFVNAVHIESITQAGIVIKIDASAAASPPPSLW